MCKNVVLDPSRGTTVVIPAARRPQGEKAKFCSFHKSASMIDVRSRRCAAPGCKRQPSYAVEGKRAAFCAAHKEEGMVDVVSRRCEEPNCRRRPLYGYEVRRGRGGRCGCVRAVDFASYIPRGVSSWKNAVFWGTKREMRARKFVFLDNPRTHTKLHAPGSNSNMSDTALVC